MTVAELIEKLKVLPQELVVLTPGFDERGFVSPNVELVEFFEFPKHDRYRMTAYRNLHRDIGDTEFTEEPAPKPIKVVQIDFGDHEEHENRNK